MYKHIKWFDTCIICFQLTKTNLMTQIVRAYMLCAYMQNVCGVYLFLLTATHTGATNVFAFDCSAASTFSPHLNPLTLSHKASHLFTFPVYLIFSAILQMIYPVSQTDTSECRNKSKETLHRKRLLNESTALLGGEIKRQNIHIQNDGDDPTKEDKLRNV